MAGNILPFELERIGQGLFVRPHKAGQLLWKRCQPGVVGGFAPERWTVGTFMKNSPSSESIFTDKDASRRYMISYMLLYVGVGGRRRGRPGAVVCARTNDRKRGSSSNK